MQKFPYKLKNVRKKILNKKLEIFMIFLGQRIRLLNCIRCKNNVDIIYEKITVYDILDIGLTGVRSIYNRKKI